MNIEHILRMAECAGLTCDERLVKFAEAIARPETAAAVEREACAQICDALSVLPVYASPVTKLAAAAIRARGEA